MGADFSNCQFNKLSDTCNSPVSMINSTLSQAATCNFVLNLEKSKFESKNNDFWFSCIENSVPYNGTLNCDVKNHATIVCGSKNITFSHKQNCLFGFQFRNNETLIYDNKDLDHPLLFFPLPADKLVVSTQVYEGESQEKWVLRNGFSGHLANTKIVSESKVEHPKSLETPFDKLDLSSILSGNSSNSGSFSIPVEENKLESGGTLSFSIPIEKIAESKISLIISDKNGKNIIQLELDKCCGKLIDSTKESYDRFLYPPELSAAKSVDVALTWKSSVYSLNLKSTNSPIALIPTENQNAPHKAILLNSSTRQEIAGNWSYSTGVRNSNSVSCTISKTDDRCKSTSVTVPKMVSPDLEFLRFGFLFSKPSSPVELSISQNSNTLATLHVTSSSISITSNEGQSEVSLKKELTTGEWVSGDIFMVSDDLNSVIENDNSITCRDFSDSCLSSQSSQSWMSTLSEGSILRYAYLKKQATEKNVIMSMMDPSLSKTPSSSSDYYLYISFKNCVIARFKVNANSFNKASINDKSGAAGLAYWRLKSGISTSINIPTSNLNSIKEKISKDIEGSSSKGEASKSNQ
ncbi:hypothetical protein OIY81_3458 [Cryptosporidium canis]|uniref:Uncharacterized protein n=1 Tax=Cryptosporidium canis TaxID=195482 RepID=A0ABQ8P7C8_9CRYT|nr:hypothetical protein OIY81_3458 [Cryptosporidium canis]KAJ1611055.1 hypothetical protein OJ252_1685 [Cryptosporidium canis]